MGPSSEAVYHKRTGAETGAGLAELSEAVAQFVDEDRRLLEGSGFTIEPGVYFPDFGVRSEINMVLGVDDAPVTGALQTEIVTLA